MRPPMGMGVRSRAAAITRTRSAAAVLVALVLLPGVGASLASTVPDRVSARVGLEAEIFQYDDAVGRNRVDQVRVPLELTFRATRSVSLVAALDAAYSSRSLDGRKDSVTEPGEAGIGVEWVGLDRRIALAAAAHASLRRDGLSADEVWVVETLEAPALPLALRRYGAGDRVTLFAAAQVLRASWIVLQLGGGFEGRGAYTLREGKQDFLPGDVFRLAASGQAVRGPWKPEIDLEVRRSAESRLRPGEAYDPGDQIEARAALSRISSDRGTFHVAVALWAREHGTTDLPSPLSMSALRGGNVLSVDAGWALPGHRWEVEPRVGLTAMRGLPGPLGHASWVEPGLGVARAAGSGKVSLRASAPLGQERSGHTLFGLRVSLGWSGGLP